MAIPNGAGGYQITSGNGEVVLSVQGAPVAKTAAATLTADELTSGIITADLSGNVNITLPIVVGAGGVAGVNDVVSSARVNSAFSVSIINLTASTHVATVVAGTGWTIVGSAAVGAASSGRFLARKTSDTTYTLYRVA